MEENDNRKVRIASVFVKAGAYICTVRMLLEFCDI